MPNAESNAGLNSMPNGGAESGSVSDETEQGVPALTGERVLFLGRLGGGTRRSITTLVREHGGTTVERGDPQTTLVVLGADQLAGDSLVDASLQQAAEQGRLAIISETEFWERIGVLARDDVRRLYTPAMLAELLKIPLATVRRWHRRGLIVAVQEVHRLPYFDFQEVASARQLAQLLAAGLSPASLEKKLKALARLVPDATRPLRQLAVIVRGREVLLRQGEGLVEPSGQLQFDFDACDRLDEASRSGEYGDRTEAAAEMAPAPTDASLKTPAEAGPVNLLQAAADCEEQGDLAQATELVRAALAAGGPRAETCFQLAELLYRQGDLPGARERYFVAIELDENFVEARASLGCVLAESGEQELAIAAFEGALAFHPDYADVHYHLARTQAELGRPADAERHWLRFLELAPDSPWADEARQWLQDHNHLTSNF